MKTLLLLFVILKMSFLANSQNLKPVKWSYAVKRTSPTEAIVIITASIESGWHIYAESIPDGGPSRATLSFQPSQSFHLQGPVKEPKPVTKFEEFFAMNVSYFENEAVFEQRVKRIERKAVVQGSVEYMACSAKKCLPPKTIEFSVPIK